MAVQLQQVGTYPQNLSQEKGDEPASFTQHSIMQQQPRVSAQNQQQSGYIVTQQGVPNPQWMQPIPLVRRLELLIIEKLRSY